MAMTTSTIDVAVDAVADAPELTTTAHVSGGEGDYDQYEGQRSDRDREIEGSWRDETLIGGGGDDEIEGKGGDDLLIGGGDDDEIDGDDGDEIGRAHV